ncbi:MAG TPA: hypothetical protein VMK66_00700 [Myxococcales bacterium]|nr:hypothetical protein [Myxococcales bacterium]
MNVKNAAIASAVASMFLASGAMAKDKPAKSSSTVVKCAGINECKGHGACAGADNACKAQNSCKGKGYEEVKSEKECKDKGGKVLAQK